MQLTTEQQRERAMQQTKSVLRYADHLELSDRDRYVAVGISGRLVQTACELVHAHGSTTGLDDGQATFAASLAIALKRVQVCEEDGSSPPLRAGEPKPEPRTPRERRDLAVCVIREAVVLSFVLLWERVKGMVRGSGPR